MKRIAPIFAGVFLLLVLIVLISGAGQTAVAQTGNDSFVYLPVVTKPTEPEYKIVFASDRDNVRGVYDIFIMNSDGTGVKNLTNTPAVSESYPTWSPNGAMIAYLSGDQGSVELFIMSNTGGDKRNVSNASSVNARGLVWSPDSSRLAFLSDRDDVEGIYDIFVVKSDGTGLTNLTHSTDRDERSLDWSPDGTKIVYLADMSLPPVSFLGHVIAMNADGTNKTTIATNNGFNMGPAWSPEGSKIAFILMGFDGDCLAVMNPDGTNQNCLTPASIENVYEGLLWNSSGSQILFKGQEAGSSFLNLFVINASDSGLTNVTINVPGYGSPFRSMDWSADDMQIVYDEDFSLLRGDISIINVDGTGYANLTNSDNDDDRWPNWSPVPLP